MTNIMIDKDEWMEVWNASLELKAKCDSLESKLFYLEERVKELEQPATIYGKEVKRR